MFIIMIDIFNNYIFKMKLPCLGAIMLNILTAIYYMTKVTNSLFSD